MNAILILTPAQVFDERQLETVRVQQHLRERVTNAVADESVQVFSALVVDGIAQEFENDVLALDYTIKAWDADVIHHAGSRSLRGVRRQTRYCIDRLARPMIEPLGADLFVLRILPEIVVTDAVSLAKDLLTTIHSNKNNFLAGSLKQTESYKCSRLGWLGIEKSRAIYHVHGDIMFAPWSVWERGYLRLPEMVHNLEDDFLFSEWVLRSDGRLVEFRQLWTKQATTARHLSTSEKEPIA